MGNGFPGEDSGCNEAEVYRLEEKRECSTIFEVKRRRAAPIVGIDQEDAGETAPHLGDQRGMVSIHRSRSRLPRESALVVNDQKPEHLTPIGSS
jgi:hypothetical protein